MTSTIDEFDARTLEPRTQHRFFSERYTGRLEQLLCLDESVQVGMDFTVVDGQELKMSLLEFQLDDPRDFTPNALGGAAGDGMAYDRRRGVVYYRSEAHELIRLDLATRQIDRQVASAIEGGLAAVGDLAIHEGRDSLFIMQAYGEVTEVDLETLEKKAEYPILAAWEIAIDEELDRLYAAGNWGLEVVDLQNGRTLKRTRLGLGGRRPAIDARNDLLYVPSTAGGRIQVFDRRSLKKVGSLRLGVGPRYPYVSAEHGYLLATNIHSYYSWNLDELAKRFR